MDLEQMQVIWDVQKKQPMCVLDDTALHAAIKSRARCVGQLVGIFEWAMIAVIFSMAAFFVIKPLMLGQDYYKLWGAGLLLLVGAYVLSGILRRRNREQHFDDSLRGDLDKAIWRIDYQVQRLKTIQWWFILPLSLLIVANMVMKFETKPLAMWLGFLAAMWVSYLGACIELRWAYRPKKQELESIREKLMKEA